MADPDPIELINKRLDWIEESLGRVNGLQYTPMGAPIIARTRHRSLRRSRSWSLRGR